MIIPFFYCQIMSKFLLIFFLIFEIQILCATNLIDLYPVDIESTCEDSISVFILFIEGTTTRRDARDRKTWFVAEVTVS